jgi:hypothetical protein
LKKQYVLPCYLLAFNILLTTSSLWILWTIVNFVRSNGGSVTLMVQQPAKDGNNTINYTILLHMPRTYYGKNKKQKSIFGYLSSWEDSSASYHDEKQQHHFYRVNQDRT